MDVVEGEEGLKRPMLENEEETKVCETIEQQDQMEPIESKRIDLIKKN